jgi:hypothetical protein
MSLGPENARRASEMLPLDFAQGRLGEGDVVVLTAVEGRVEVGEVDGLVLDVLAEDAEVVAVIELVLLCGLHCGVILTRIKGRM